jgi:hypothetical protein
LHFAIKASGNRLIKLEIVMKVIRSNGDDDKKTNQQRHWHTTTKRLSIKKSTRDKKLTFKFKVKNWDREWERERLRRELSPQLRQRRLGRWKAEQAATVKELKRKVEVENLLEEPEGRKGRA